MSIVESELSLLRHPRLAALVVGASPAWLWSTDATRILWANAAGAALFGAAGTAAIRQRHFDTKAPAAAQVLRLAATLPPAGAQRLERLRGFGSSFGRALTCACSRITLGDGKAAVLVAAVEPVGPALTLGERACRLFGDDTGALAFFAADGTLLHANAAAQAQLSGTTTLSDLGIDALAAAALETGHAGGAASGCEATLDHIGEAASRVLVVALRPRPSAKAAPAPVSDIIAAFAAAEVLAPPSAETPAPGEPLTERRHPLRFVWQMDADSRFVVGSDEFIELVGPQTTAAFGRKWSEIAAEAKLDPENLVARAVATQETWSGIVIAWPVDDSDDRLPVELSGLPVFDRDRTFRGYRGFGVCRDLARINQLIRARRERPAGYVPAEALVEAKAAVASGEIAETAEAETVARMERPALVVAPASANVVPFRYAPSAEPKAPVLSPVERRAFRELAQELTARLRGTPEAPAAASGDEPDARNDAAEAQSDAGAAQQRQAIAAIEPSLLERMPVGVLVYRHDSLLYANRHFLESSGCDDLDALAGAGGLSALFADAGALAEDGGARSLSIKTGGGEKLLVDGRLFTVPWHGAPALALVLTGKQDEERLRKTEQALAVVERDLRGAKREAEKAETAKAEFLAKVSHEIRTPLNAITGFAEVIMAERFGPIGNERYREYLKDIHGAGTQVVSILNDLLDLSKIESGRFDLSFADVNLNDLTQQCVAIMQPHANRARIIIRTSLTPGLPRVVADERSLRQIVLNLLSNSIKLTGPGGQVIVSTGVAGGNEAVLRVRDTGVGMSEKDVEAVLEPFRQAAPAGHWGSGGTGLGLPLTKALAEANRANFSIKSAPNAGTLVEVAFPRTAAAQ